MKLTFLGANHEVTGSCTLLEAAGQRYLIDCGMEQGKDTYENQPIPVAPGEIDGVLATHAHIDHTGLLPLLLKTRHAHNPFFPRTRSVISIHNAAFQGVFDRQQFWAVPEIQDYEQRINYDYGHINLLKCGVLYADKINAVSPNYASELLTHLGAHGMASVFQQRAADLRGILNGCDYQDWDPAFDPLLPATYDADNLDGKHTCKIN